MALNGMQVRELVDALDLDLHETGICLACLCIVSHALDSGDEADVRRTVASMSADLWHDGLALPLRAALERARRGGVADADPAIVDVERRGHRSPVVRAAVRRLAVDLLGEMKEMRPTRAAVIPLRPG
jgi:hypothetical protein